MTVKRMLDVSFSETMRISKLATKMEEAGDDIISLAVGEPDFDTPDFIIEAAYKAMKDGFTHYTNPQGISELREMIAKKSRKENHLDFDKENVLITPTKQAIFMSVMAHLDDGAEAVITDPTWVSYKPMIKFADGIPRRVPFVKNGDGDGFYLDEEVLKENISSRTEMMILNTPSNPLGISLSKEELKSLVDVAIDNDLLVVMDEVYEKLIFEGNHISIGSMDGMRDRTITVSGFSKSYAMTGWRLGWLLCSEDLMENIIKIQTHSITCATSFGQKAGVTALKDGDEAIDEMVETYRKRRDIIVDRLNDIDGFDCVKPDSTFYTFPSYDFDVPSMDMSMYLLEEAKVATTPGSAFGDEGEKHLRMSYANSTENIKEALDRIEEAVQDL
ncbi:MAG: pyridoxal phosphate-dependent aminotransferase [Thermoplasmatota archaeon]